MSGASTTAEDLAAVLLTDELSCWVYAPDYLTYPEVAEALGEPCLSDVDASRRASAHNLAAGIASHIADDLRAAARLRSLAAIYEQPLNRGKTFTFTGRELAAMLKEEG